MQISIAEKLKEERERLGFSQEAMGAIGGVTKLTQFNYEAGKRSPDALYLEALSKIGVDVLYLVTGQRMSAMLEDEERLLINYYRSAPESIKKAALGVLLSVQPDKNTKESAKPKRKNVQIANASNVIQIGGNNQGDINNETKGRKRK